MKLSGMKSSLFVGAVVIASVSTGAYGVTVVNSFGDGGWYSSDTRDSGGTNLFGATSTHPQINAFAGGAVPGDDAKIADRLAFVDEVTGPAGSLNGKGAILLNASDENAGKAHFSVLNRTTGFGAGSALIDSGFSLSYRYYNQPVPTSRTPAISITVTDNATQGSYYTFSHLDPSNSQNAWNDDAVTSDSGTWRLYGNGVLGAASGSSGPDKTLEDWALDGTFAALLTGDYTIYEIGFNIGSSARRNNTYFDWFQSNLVNGGDLVDFQAIPEPTALSLLGIGAAAMLRRRRA